jgi:hypothetical protein
VRGNNIFRSFMVCILLLILLRWWRKIVAGVGEIVIVSHIQSEGLNRRDKLGYTGTLKETVSVQRDLRETGHQCLHLIHPIQGWFPTGPTGLNEHYNETVGSANVKLMSSWATINYSRNNQYHSLFDIISTSKNTLFLLTVVTIQIRLIFHWQYSFYFNGFH